MQPNWKFRKTVRGEMNSDPVEGEFFSTEHLESLSDALVRESIQNSLDASLGGTCEVLFRLAALGHEFTMSSKYFSGIMEHLSAHQSGLAWKPDMGQHIDFLTVEDFGTRGLEGDVSMDDDLDEPLQMKNDFYYFWRNVGRSRKSEGDRGRWGLGKTVFQASSRINSFWGLSIRQSDSTPLLMGQAVLKTHKVGGVKHYPYGWFGRYGDGGGGVADFAMPETDPAYIAEFAEAFGLERGGRSGLSVIIPFPEESIKCSELISSVVKHYFFPVLAGKLVVRVIDGGRETVIDNNTIDNLISEVTFGKGKFKREDLSRLFRLSRWALSLKGDGFYELSQPSDGRLQWSETFFDTLNLDALRSDFEAGKRLAFRVPMDIRKRVGGQTHDTFFHVFLERDGLSETSQDHFIRDGITLTGVSTLRQKGVRAIISILDRPLSEFLGDAENPAHTAWHERSPKFKDKYDKAPTRLRFVKNSPREIASIVSRPAKGRDEEVLANIFYLDEQAIERQTRVPGGGPGLEAGDAGGSPEMDYPDKNLRIKPLKGGFRVAAINHARQVPDRLSICMAYEIRQGNPFNAYSPFDFKLNAQPIVIKSEHTDSVKPEGNTLSARISDSRFTITVKGFDQNRDLRVKVKTPDVDIKED